MTISRRRLLKGLGLAAAASVVPALPSWAAPIPPVAGWSGERMELLYGAGGYLRYPLLRLGEPVTATEKITSVDFFQPFFGPDRKVVNPSAPIVRERTILFREPGEYYLRINKSTPLRAVVFSSDEGVMTPVLRLFDFMVANQFYAGAQDMSWYVNREKYIKRFFVDERPLMLSCGPTHQVFRYLLEDRFCVPTRIATSASNFYLDDRITRLTHNVPEVYLPELDKYVLFDLNTGFVPKWMDAIDLAEATRVLGNYANDFERDSEVTEVHARVPTCPSKPIIGSLVAATDDWGTIEFSGNYVGDTPVDEFYRARGMRSWYSGPFYFGKKAVSVRPTGTEFLESGTLLWARMVDDPALEQDIWDWLTPTVPREEIEVVSPDELRNRLWEGHLATIRAEEWKQRFPSRAS
ncbi:MAG TPA: twin-arginine translocation signal domain-containing protein [Thermoanaerobaculia bacterium]|jgi:hypothetical protein